MISAAGELKVSLATTPAPATHALGSAAHARRPTCGTPSSVPTTRARPPPDNAVTCPRGRFTRVMALLPRGRPLVRPSRQRDGPNRR